MNIHDIEIEHIRGVTDKITMNLGGKNAVIYGPNGTGKSGIVDAIDFLFTGDISRLSGRGSRGMTLKDHGPHIDSTPKDAIIRATVSFNGGEPVQLERCMLNPKLLVGYDALDVPYKAALDIAAKGQHVLSRSEILKFVEAEAGQRSKEIQALLNLNKIEDLRATFVTINRDAGKDLQSSKSTYETSIAKVKDVLGLTAFSEEQVLSKVNEHRKTLAGTEIDALVLKQIKADIKPITKDSKERVNPEQLKTALSAIRMHLENRGQPVLESEIKLRAEVKRLKEDNQLRRDLQNKRLLDLGISLLDESGSCPLCLTEFSPGELSKLLQARQTTARQAEEIERSITDLSTSINTDVSTLKGHVELLSVAAKRLKQDDIEKGLKGWAISLSEWSTVLGKAVEDYPIAEVSDRTEHFFSYDGWEKDHETLSRLADGLEKSSPEQTAWDALTALEPVLGRYFEDKDKYEKAQKHVTITKALTDTYTATKDKILEDLYQSVNADFTDYYKFLHSDDETGFDSELKPDGAQLDFKVDFYGRGKHHPRALHSEGHQDSMGLCLFLALNKKISEGKVGFVILDDVVMSIDSEHRRNICKMLTDKFPNMQFLITTHNTTWAQQLKSDKVVTSKNMVRFVGWSVDSGPRIRDELGTWEAIDRNLQDHDIPGAAAHLRRYLESLFETVADSLKAKVTFKIDGRYELGDYLKGCKQSLSNLMKLAKKSAKSWGKDDDCQRLEELETQIKEIIARSQSEQWGINAAVHYNKWQDFTLEDFQPIVEAFKDFESLFRCSSCDRLLYLGMQEMEPVALRCPCGTVNWNLVEKPK